MDREEWAPHPRLSSWFCVILAQSLHLLGCVICKAELISSYWVLWLKGDTILYGGPWDCSAALNSSPLDGPTLGHKYPTHLHPRNASLTLHKMLILFQLNFTCRTTQACLHGLGVASATPLRRLDGEPWPSRCGAVVVSWGSCSCLYPGLWLLRSISLHA